MRMDKYFLTMACMAMISACDVPPKTPKSDPQKESFRDEENAFIEQDDQSIAYQLETEDDQAIIRGIQTAVVADDFLSQDARNIKITSVNGVVTLSGKVRSGKEKDLIQVKAKGTSGVKRVINELEIK